jgi:hypothetical protein
LVYDAFNSYLKKINNPISLLLFLEHYPFSRAVSLAAKNCRGKKIKVNVMQHASYSKGKTFAYIDPVDEFKNSNIDGMQLPHADQIFVMGLKNYQLFKSFGYPQDFIIQTGSCRYEKSFISTKSLCYHKEVPFVILLPLSVKKEIHIDLIKAVYHAIKNIENIKIVIRNHPYWDIKNVSEWVRENAEYFHFSNQSLNADFESANLVISAYSTVAEEAIFFGLPVIQWQGLDFEGSPLAYDPEIIKVNSFDGLKATILAHISDYSKHIPSALLKQKMYEKYFSPSNLASNNIATFFKKDLL